MASEDRPSPSPEARLAIEGLLAGKTLDDVAPRGTSVRGEVEAHLIRSLESAGRAHAAEPATGRARAKTAPRTPGSAAKSAAKPAAKSGAKTAAKPAGKSAAHPPAHGASPHAARTKAVIAYSDGASRGNPGPAAIGFLLRAADGSELWSEGRCIGRTTNNVAEYHGAIAALEKARELGIEEMELRMDSELVVKQLLGLYRVKEPSLAELKRRIDGLRASFRTLRFRHVRREENHEADRLANEALDG